MKSIWHTPDEKPKHNKRILAHTLMDDYVALYAYPVEWEMQVRAYQIDKYTNLDDLLALESKLAESDRIVLLKNELQKQVEKELRDTKTKLETAVKALEYVKKNCMFIGDIDKKHIKEIAETALKEIGK